MDNATIQEFLDEHDYDIRKTHNGRWIDQKCTMDVVCLVSDCIVEYTSGRNRKSFTVNDIWYNDYTVDNVQQIFSKPNPTEKASNEYDKYFGQPIKLLDAAGIIHGEKSGHGYVYSIVNQDLLEYIRSIILLRLKKYFQQTVNRVPYARKKEVKMFRLKQVKKYVSMPGKIG